MNIEAVIFESVQTILLFFILVSLNLFRRDRWGR